MTSAAVRAASQASSSTRPASSARKEHAARGRWPASSRSKNTQLEGVLDEARRNADEARRNADEAERACEDATAVAREAELQRRPGPGASSRRSWIEAARGVSAGIDELPGASSGATPAGASSVRWKRDWRGGRPLAARPRAPGVEPWSAPPGLHRVTPDDHRGAAGAMTAADRNHRLGAALALGVALALELTARAAAAQPFELLPRLASASS